MPFLGYIPFLFLLILDLHILLILLIVTLELI